MNIIKEQNGTTLTLALEGRLDTTTAPQLEAELNASLPGTEVLIYDFEKLDYISSAGLRLMLSSQKTMSKQGSMVLRNVCADIMEIFDITGFTDILTIE